MTCISVQTPPLPHSIADKGMGIICEADVVCLFLWLLYDTVSTD